MSLVSGSGLGSGLGTRVSLGSGLGTRVSLGSRLRLSSSMILDSDSGFIPGHGYTPGHGYIPGHGPIPPIPPRVHLIPPRRLPCHRGQCTRVRNMLLGSVFP